FAELHISANQVGYQHKLYVSFSTHKVTENQSDSRFHYVIYCYLIYSFSDTYHICFLPQFLLAFG
ncbi:hypothetical protein, partial [Prevotella denticola]|uniref:hypothetical protein n=1 Tax=Prevotella denticola TaxID=28129 RepID=UPI0028E2584D